MFSKYIFANMILDYKNSTIHFTTEGKGQSVVLLHGFLESVNMWNDLVPKLTNAHQVICIDLLGHGQTECLGYVHTMETMAEAVFAVLEYLNIEKAHFIGHSMGAYVALALAEKHPNLFNGLCLMNSTFEADTEERKLIRSRACKMAQTNYEALVKMSFANLFTAESKIKHEADYNKALQQALLTPVQGYIAAQEGMKLRPNYIKLFKKLPINKIIIIGEEDGLIDSDSLTLQIKNTDIDYALISGGHMSYIENKSELTYVLLHFIEK